MKLITVPGAFQQAPIIDGRVECLFRGEAVDIEVCVSCPSLQRFSNTDEPHVVCRDHV